jgi:hypothetical protein
LGGLLLQRPNLIENAMGFVVLNNPTTLHVRYNQLPSFEYRKRTAAVDVPSVSEPIWQQLASAL